MADTVLKFATTMSLSRIKPGQNPRRYFDQAKHDDLVASIRLRGVIQPLLIRPVAGAEGEYSIVAGERRYKAAGEALGADADVPVLIREMTDQEALEAAIDENDNREDASETEQADAAVRVLAACQGDRAEAARRLAWSPSKLDRRLALANLAERVKAALDERMIKVGHAELLAAVPSDKQEKALDTILINSLSVAKTRELLMRVTQRVAPWASSSRRARHWVTSSPSSGRRPKPRKRPCRSPRRHRPRPQRRRRLQRTRRPPRRRQSLHRVSRPASGTDTHQLSTTICREAPMQINHLTRVYRYDGIDLPIPPHLSNDPQGLRAYHASLYPAILNAEAVDAGVSGTNHVTEYRRAVGTKG